MSHDETQSVLRRKLRQGAGSGEDRQGEADGGLIRALRLGMARAARQAFGLRVDVIGATRTTGTPEELTTKLSAKLAGDQLLILLEGADGVSGALALGPDLARALVQQQTVGVLSLSDPADRRFTATDAALCAPLVDRLLTQSISLTDSPADKASLTGHRFGAQVQEAQAVAVALEAEPFHAITLTLDIAEGAAQSALTLMLPTCPVPAACGGGDRPASPRQLGDVAMNVPVRLNAVMCRVSMMWSDLAGMRPGDRMPLPAYRLDRTELLTMSGHPVGVGRLGKVDGLRAVRVNETSAPDSAFSEAQPMPEPASPAVAPLVTIEAGSDSTDGPASAGMRDDEDLPLDLADQDEALRRISELAGLDGDLVEATPVP